VQQRAAGRRVGRAVNGDDPAHHDAVIAAVVHRLGPAFQRGQRRVQQRRAGHRARMVVHPVQLPVHRSAPQGQPARGLLVVLGQDRHRPRPFGQDRVVEAGDLLGAEQHQRRIQ